MNNNYIKTDEHVFITGANGTGKTLLAKIYTAGYDNVLVLDTKGTFDYTPFLLQDKYKIVTNINLLYNERKVKKIIYRPNIHENNIDYYDKFFEFCYRRQNTIVLVDEAMHVCTSHNIPFWYKSILTRGRELDVTCWSCTQRPNNVSNFILTESIHWFIFRLNNYQDREKIFKSSGMSAFKRPTKGHYFYYWFANSNKVILTKLDLDGLKI
jgi:hypothetical protein